MLFDFAEGLSEAQILWALAGLIIAALVGYLYRWYSEKSKLEGAKRLRNSILENANREAELLKRDALLSGRDEIHRERIEAEREIERRREEIARVEERIKVKEESLGGRADLLERRSKDLEIREKKILDSSEELDRAREKYRALLEEAGKMTAEEAKATLMKAMEDEARAEASRLIRRIEEDAARDANIKAQKIISVAIQRLASETTSERTVSSVTLPSDDMKGRIIGREGRNIREFERLTGVDLIIDDTPEAVLISCFDPIRRETARLALLRLVADGRIHPARIEEMVSKAEKEIQEEVRKAGEEMTYSVGVHNMRPELVKTLGRLKYRTSYGQNILVHSLEVTYIGSILAAELGLDVAVVKRACLLHDIGKAVDQDVEGPHAEVGAEIAARYGESPTVVEAIRGHHAEAGEQTIEAIIVHAADAISAARPGARMENVDTYIKRIEKLEKIASGENGVERVYAIQAGREIRVFVNHSEVSDKDSSRTARSIAKRIEKELEYPGQIRVTVIRETRAVDYAK